MNDFSVYPPLTLNVVRLSAFAETGSGLIFAVEEFANLFSFYFFVSHGQSLSYAR